MVVDEDTRFLNLVVTTGYGKQLAKLLYDTKKGVFDDIDKFVLEHKANDKFLFQCKEQRKRFNKLKQKHLRKARKS